MRLAKMHPAVVDRRSNVVLFAAGLRLGPAEDAAVGRLVDVSNGRTGEHFFDRSPIACRTVAPVDPVAVPFGMCDRPVTAGFSVEGRRTIFGSRDD
jgi:hypothetical protein